MSTRTDTVFTKSVIMNGKKLSGVQRVEVVCDITEVATKINLTLLVRKDSLSIKDNVISFDEVDPCQSPK